MSTLGCSRQAESQEVFWRSMKLSMALQVRSKPVPASAIYISREKQCRLRPGFIDRDKPRHDLSCQINLTPWTPLAGSAA